LFRDLAKVCVKSILVICAVNYLTHSRPFYSWTSRGFC